MTDTYPNPIKAKDRGRIIVAGIIATGATGTITMAEAAAGLPAPWIAVTASALAFIGVVATSLARANLTPDDIKPQAPRSDE